MDCLICSKSRSRPLKGSPHLDNVLSALGEMFPSFNWIDYSELIIICLNCTKQFTNIKGKLDLIAKLQEEVVELKGKVEDSLWIGKDHKIDTSQASQSIRKELLKGIETRRALKAIEDSESSGDTTNDPASPEVMDQVIRDSQSFVVSYESQYNSQPCDNEVKIDISTNDMNQEGGMGSLQKQKKNQESFKMNPGNTIPSKEIHVEKLISECFEKRAVIKLQRIPKLAVTFEPASDSEESKGSTDLPESNDDLGVVDSDEYQPEVKQEPRKLIYTNRPGTNTQNKSQFTCSCGQSYLSKSLLTAHRKADNCKDICETCGKEFIELKRHQLKCTDIHEKTKVYQCDKCPAQLLSRKQFEIHVLKHDQGINTLKCEQCDIVCANNRRLSEHVKRIHENMYLACEICGKVMRERHLKTHKKTMHDQDFKCFCPKEGCGKGFIRQSGLTNHLLWHSSDVPRPRNIKCRFCPKLFTFPSARKKLHKPEKMLACEKCDVKCPDKYSFDRHMETHSSVRKWKCDDCGADFKVKAYLYSHRNRKCAPWPNKYKKKKKLTGN